MNNLENYGVISLDDKDLNEKNGGWFPGLGLIIIGNAIGYGAFMAGWDAAKAAQ